MRVRLNNKIVKMKMETNSMMMMMRMPQLRWEVNGNRKQNVKNSKRKTSPNKLTRQVMLLNKMI
jgi:hypothetical protein